MMPRLGERGPGDADAAFVLGLRGTLMNLDVDFPGLTAETKTTGGSLLGGLGIWIGQRQTVEVLVEYGRGYTSTRGTGAISNTDEGDYDLRGLGVNYLWTFPSGFQAGANLGYTRIDVDLPTSSGTVSGRGDGFDAGLVIGWRF